MRKKSQRNGMDGSVLLPVVRDVIGERASGGGAVLGDGGGACFILPVAGRVVGVRWVRRS